MPVFPLFRCGLGGVAVKFMQTLCDRTRLAFADSPAVDFDNWQRTDCCGSDECLARVLSLGDRESPLDDRHLRTLGDLN